MKGRFGVAYTPNALSKLLRRLGFVHEKPVCVPAKADEGVQLAFVETVLKPLMKDACQTAPLDFVDATRPSYTGRPAHGWIRRGRRVELKSNHGRSRLDINGASSWPGRSLLVHRREDLVTSAAMIRLYDDPCARHPSADRITVVLDNARYNLSREIKAHLAKPGCRIRLVHLPSYAPDRNLIERFWHVMKRKVLFNKAYETFAHFAKAFDVFERLPEHKGDLEPLVTDSFHFIGEAGNGIRPA